MSEQVNTFTEEQNCYIYTHIYMYMSMYMYVNHIKDTNLLMNERKREREIHVGNLYTVLFQRPE